MATKKQKEKLIETLKFTPRTYTVHLTGYGGEVVLGTVSKAIVDYFNENDLDIEEFANDWDNEMDVPEDNQPFTPGEWHDCDNIAHANGVEMNESCMISVYDENDNLVWEHNLDPGSLEESGIGVNSGEEYYASQQDCDYVFYGQSFEKGTFQVGNIYLREPFTPSKLFINYVDVEGWYVSDGIEYDGEYIDNEDSSTTGKSMTFQFLEGKLQSE